MKLLCDVCENEAACLICCADQAALCLSCDSRIHAANKLAGKHQRVPVLAEPSQPAVCDICQDQPSFFFCIEDRALLCRDCDASIHSVNALAARHRRFLLTGIQVGSSFANSTSPEQTSAISLEQYPPRSSPSHRAPAVAMKKQAAMEAVTKATCIMSRRAGVQRKGLCEPGEPSNRAMKRPFKTAAASSPVAGNGTDMNSGLCKSGTGSKAAIASEKPSASGPATAETPRSYTMNKQGTLSIPSSDRRNTETRSNGSSKSTTISIRRISAGRVPFVAPVLSSLSEALKQENACNSIVSDLRQQEEASNRSCTNMQSSNGGDRSNHLINSAVTMEADDCPPASSDNVSDYLVSGVSGWRLDELLNDLISGYESDPSPLPSKEGNAPGCGIQEDPSWYAELDFMADHSCSNRISLPAFCSQEEEGAALVPDVPSPPTASGMVTSHGKPTCPAASAAKAGAAQPWEFDHLFMNAQDYPSEFSVVPDIDFGSGSRSSPTLTPSNNSRSGYGGSRSSDAGKKKKQLQGRIRLDDQ